METSHILIPVEVSVFPRQYFTDNHFRTKTQKVKCLQFSFSVNNSPKAIKANFTGSYQTTIKWIAKSERKTPNVTYHVIISLVVQHKNPQKPQISIVNDFPFALDVSIISKVNILNVCPLIPPQAGLGTKTRTES